jgi:phage terminase small subunit
VEGLTMAHKPLSPKQRQFCVEYLIDMNATRAYMRTYGCDHRNGEKCGPRLMHKPHVKAEIQRLIGEQQKRTLITADQVLLDIQDIGDRALSDKDYAQALRSRELLGKRYKLFTDKVEVVQNVPRAERLRQARERRQKA